MPLEKFSVLKTWEDALKMWSRQLEYIQRNFDASGVLIKDASSHFDAKNVEDALEEMFNNRSNLSIYEKTITHTLASSESGLIKYNSTADIVSNLPTTVGNEELTYSLTNIAAYVVSVTPFSTAQTIHGDITFDLYEDENIQISSDGANWYVS